MRILVGCEESQAVTIELRKLGHEAYSCDVLDCSGGYPEWHIKGDVLKTIYNGWDAIIAFPPCTHLACSGAKHFKEKIKDGRQAKAVSFFMEIMSAPVEKIAIENPVGIMSSVYRKPDQIIQPYYFGDPHQKTTCLWLKNLPLLYHNAAPNLFDEIVTHTHKGDFHTTKGGNKLPSWYNLPPSEDRAKQRSKTFPGIAKAMAKQWTENL